MSRDSHLDKVPGFVEFHLLRGPEAEDHTLYASHTVWKCQSAPKLDPSSASNFDPFERRDLLVALGASELAGVAETRRARVAWSSSRLLNRQLSFPVSTMSQ